jgi:hypothetical protein
MTDAERQANLLRTQADQYVSTQLSNLERRLQRVMQELQGVVREVQAGQRMLGKPPDVQHPQRKSPE